MELVRFSDASGRAQAGVTQDGFVCAVAATDMAELLRLPLPDLRGRMDDALAAGVRMPLADVTLLAPIDGRTEVWGAGVTYLRSREARVEESGFDRIYSNVYDAPRPELFFKSPAWRVLPDGQSGGLRADSTDSVPEPELALVLNRHAEIVGALVCNDLTARSIEAENPIYLPQAKSYAGSCALSTAIVPWWQIDDPMDLTIRLTIDRGDDRVFDGQCCTAAMKRSFAELVDWLFRAIEFPDGVVLSTGTGIVPPLGEGVQAGDRVTVTIDGVGSLTNVMAVAPSVPSGGAS
jgi:2-dehydro-3-deoxy-D-arabinonate dehydratase